MPFDSSANSSSSSSDGNTQTSNNNSLLKVWTKQEYVDLLVPYSKPNFELLKKSIKEHGLLNPIVLNQNNVVLDGHHRMRACIELGVQISYNRKDFTGRPTEELRYVVHVNLHRRHLSQFERAEMGLKMYNIIGTIAQRRQQASHFTPETGKAAAVKRSHGGDNSSGKPLSSLEAEDSDNDVEGKDSTPLRSSQEIGDEVGLSHATIERVKAILEDGTQDEIDGLRPNYSPGIKTVYNEIRNEEKV
jgi:hypothetical protein